MNDLCSAAQQCAKNRLFILVFKTPALTLSVSGEVINENLTERNLNITANISQLTQFQKVGNLKIVKQ